MKFLETITKCLNSFIIAGLFEGLGKYFVRMFEELGEEVKHWPGYETYGEKLVELSKVVVPQVIEAIETKPGQFRVLCHGDCWINNVLFKYDDQGSVQDACLVRLSFRAPFSYRQISD